MKQKAEIYIHIPFCVKKCDYCDFLSASADDATKQAYVRALLKEIGAASKELAKYPVDAIFFGGGTPSILEPTLLCQILDCIRKYASITPDAEITVECNPGTLTKEKLDAYMASGVNRLSIGLQSTKDEELKSIGRIHTWQQFVKNYQLARSCGFKNINIDLMSALPNQTLSSYKEGLEKVLALEPEHISAYSLIVEEGTVLYERVHQAEIMGRHILPDEDTEREMYYITKRLLEKNGYDRYEISNYSKKGMECRHNIGYWRRKNYLGFGIGAASLWENQRYQNIKNITEYLNIFEQDLPEEKIRTDLRENIETLTDKEQMEEFMFLGLRMTEGVSKSEFHRLFGRTMESVYEEIIKKLKTQNLIKETQERIWLTELGIDVSNVVLAQFLLD